MRSVVIAESESYSVTSWGNGAAYCLANKIDGRDVLFQGDDAGIFRDEWDAMEKARPNDSVEVTLGELWGQYSEVSSPSVSP